MNELVRLTTQDVGKAIPITDTLIIAEKYQIKHLSVIKLIEKYSEDFKEFGELMSFQMTLEDGRKSFRAYELSEEHFYLLVTYMKNTEIARFYKKEFIKAFMFHKKELKARSQTRHIGIAARKNLTDTIKKCVTDEGSFKNWAYSTYSKLIYKKVLGKDVKKAKLERNVKEKGNIRDYLTIEELEKVQELESKIATFIEFTDTGDMTDKEVYALVKNHIEK